MRNIILLCTLGLLSPGALYSLESDKVIETLNGRFFDIRSNPIVRDSQGNFRLSLKSPNYHGDWDFASGKLIHTQNGQGPQMSVYAAGVEEVPDSKDTSKSRDRVLRSFTKFFKIPRGADYVFSTRSFFLSENGKNLSEYLECEATGPIETSKMFCILSNSELCSLDFNDPNFYDKYRSYILDNYKKIKIFWEFLKVDRKYLDSAVYMNSKNEYPPMLSQEEYSSMIVKDHIDNTAFKRIQSTCLDLKLSGQSVKSYAEEVGLKNGAKLTHPATQVQKPAAKP